MKKHYTSILIMLFFIFFSDSIYAQQPYYTVPATGNGNFNVGNVIVSVTRQGDASTFTCFGNPLPYFQGIRNNGKVSYTFNKPIAGVKIYGFVSTAVNNIISVSVNGSPYALQNSNFSAYTGICSWGSGAISGGKLINGDGVLTIIQPGITSIEVTNTGGLPGGEWIFNTDILPLVTTANAPCLGSALNLASDFGGLTSGVTYNWTGPNGFTSTLQNPSINNASTANAGTYTVTASNGTITASQTQEVYVNPIPTVNNVSNQTVCNSSMTNAVNFSSNTTGVLCGSVLEGGTLNLKAPPGSTFTNVLFASYGNPTGNCGSFALGSCHSSSSVSVVSAIALGQNSFRLNATNDNFGDPCSGTPKNLKVQLNYSTPVTYSWTNNQPSIGLASSGTGNIPSFTATNTTNAPITATITVTPRYTNLGTTCSGAPITFAITVNPSPRISAQPLSKTICAGANTTFSATVNNATAYQWQVNTGSGFTNLSNTPPYSGTTTATLTVIGVTATMNGYLYRLTATGNCSPSATSNNATLTVPTISCTLIVGNVTCNGASTGSINLTPSGGTSPYAFDWGGGITTEDRTGLAAGSYTVTITDANGCTGIVSASIAEPTALSAAAASQNNVDCNGHATGSATVNVTGGTGSYSYSWDTTPVQTTSTATGLAAGTYVVTVRDSNNCSTTRSFTITEEAPITAPTGDPVQSFNAGDDLSVLVINGQNIKWYATAETAANHTDELPINTVLINDTVYYATQTISNCEASASLAVRAFNPALAIGENVKYNFILYPNPTKDILNFIAETVIEKVIIYDMNGRKIMEHLLNGDTKIDVQSLANGAYLTQVFAENKFETLLFIKD